jgi:hypothetical protein
LEVVTAIAVGQRTARVQCLSPGFAVSVEQLASVEPAVVFGQGLLQQYRPVVPHLARSQLEFDKPKQNKSLFGVLK